MDLSYHLWHLVRAVRRRPRGGRPLQRNGPVAGGRATGRSPPGDPGEPCPPHLGIAGGTDIGYGAATVHSYRLQAKQRAAIQ